MLVENQPSKPQHARLQHRAQHCLDQRLPRLEVLADDGHALFDGQPLDDGHVHREARAAVDEGHALQHGRVGVEHRRGDELVVLLQAAKEVFDVLVDLRLGDELLGGGGVDHDEAVAAVGLLEAANVLADSLDEVELGGDSLHVVAGDALDVVVVEGGGHGFDALQEVGNGLDVLMLVQHAGLERRLVGIVRNRVPRAEDKLVELRQRHEFLHRGRSAVSPFAHTNGAHLGDGTDGLAHAAPYVLHAGDKGG